MPEGLAPGGLQIATGANARWDGASAPTQNGNLVNIVQNESQAVLHWETFNIGRGTTLNFDQSAGGADVGKWIAFNKIVGSSATPSRILGSIKAQGQVYVINQNGIIFDGTSQVNTRALVASSLPINDLLIERGILNQDKGNAQFLFSYSAQGGAPPPPPPNTPNGLIGDVIVRPGARITTSVSQEGGGGRVALIGPNVYQGGTITTPSGQTIIAAGLQVGLSAHPSSDPTLRGLDVYVGEVGTYGGTARNTGLISIPTGSLTMAGRRVEQNGGVEGLTTVTLNSRVDLLANYDALPNENFDPAIQNSPDPFLHRSSGTVSLGARSAIQIMPDSQSGARTVGSTLPLRTQINIQGLNIHFGDGSTILAPNAAFTARSGNWGAVILSTNASGTLLARRVSDSFVYTGGEIVLGSDSLVDVSGSTEVFVPLAHSILEVQLRGNELSMSPLQRSSELRGVTLLIDSRRTGTYNGRQWVGTPLGDASGFLNLIERNAPQLSAAGGSILLQSGGTVTARPGSVLDVSGGYFRHEGGRVQTTRLLYQGRHIINIAEATPDRLYDAIYDGKTSKTHQKWGITKTYLNPLAPLGSSIEPSHVAGAGGGSLSIAAPGMSIDGSLVGQTVAGPRQIRKSVQLSEMPEVSTLSLRFEGQQLLAPGSTTYVTVSPTPPRVTLGGPPNPDSGRLATLSFRQGSSAGAELVIPQNFFESSGFGALDIKNDDGEFLVPAGRDIELPPYTRLSATGRKIDIQGSIRAPGGSLAFIATHVSPYLTEIENALIINYTGPQRDFSRGSVTLGPSSRLDVAGLVLDDRHTAPVSANVHPVAINGGSISLTGFNVTIPEGASLDASGGLIADVTGDYAYGDAGSISLSAGNDPNYPSLLGGKLLLKGTLSGYAGRGKDGGTLAIKAPFIQIGGSPLHADSLVLDPAFFSRGGFQNFVLTGIGAPVDGFVPNPADPEAPQPFVPAVFVAPGTVVEPTIESLAYVPFPGRGRAAGTRRLTRPLGERPPVSISLLSSTIRNDFADPSFAGNPQGAPGQVLVVRGDVVLSEGARIQTEPGGSLTLRGSTVTVLGSLIAPGGRITISGANSFPQTKFLEELASNALATVFIGPQARLAAAGAAVYLPDSFGRRIGRLYDGGSITVSGNIVAEAGALLDVSGTSAIFDFHPSALALADRTKVPANSGLNSRPYVLRTVPYRVDSNGGTIALAGGQFLYSDATLLGRTGGPTALGGLLQVSSGRFYLAGSTQSSADINMVVSQSGKALFGGRIRGIGRPVRDAMDVVRQGEGYFAADTFLRGGFDSLDLNFYFDRNTQPVPRGGNIRFDGDVRISARGFLRVAGGGVVQANGAVRLSAPYVAIGQAFPQPGDEYEPFRIFNAALNQTTQDFFPPTSGSGSLSVDATLLDVGTLVMRSIGSARFSAHGGDIRGSGSLNIAGSLTLEAAQIYPVTLGKFDIFAYDHAGGTGSITIRKSGSASAPLSAGGSLRLYASRIDQGGTLLAPFGSITIGWDGTDEDTSTAALNQPVNPVVGNVLPVPVSQSVILRSGSLASVAGIDFASGVELLVPYGLSRDGVTVLDPSGLNITSSGLPEKRVVVAGNSIITEAGSVIDLRGGGDLFAYRWVSGPGGTVDLLGTPSGEWLTSTTYSAGSLVTYNGKTYSARVLIDPANFAFGRGPEPGINRYWSEVEESYAIVPGYTSRFAPFAPFNTISADSLEALGGDPGYVGNSLQLGDQIHLDGGSGLAAGSYTLLPRRYALLPGAFVVTPKSSGHLGIYSNAEGATFVTGYRYNSFNRAPVQSALRSLFEIASPAVFAGRAEYEVFSLSDFLTDAARRLNLTETQRLPVDSGSLLLSGNTAMSLAGSVLSRPSSHGGRGAMIDIASFADIALIGSAQSSPGTVVLNTGILSGFGAESLLIGGVRRKTADGFAVEVRSQNIVVDNNGTPLASPDIALFALKSLTIAQGAQIHATGDSAGTAGNFFVSGDGAALRAALSPGARIVRSGVTSSPDPLLTIGGLAQVSGRSVTLDSSYGFDMDPDALVASGALTYGAGQIGILLDGPTALTGRVDPSRPQLALEGDALRAAQAALAVRLIAYQTTIDIYGPGRFGGPASESVVFEAGEIRGFNQGAGTSEIQADRVEFANPRNVPAIGPVDPASGNFLINAGSVAVSGGDVFVNQFADFVLNAPEGILFSGTGGLRAGQNLTANTPLVTAARGANQNLVAAGALVLNKVAGTPAFAPGLGAILRLGGSSVSATSDILLPSGLIEVLATGAGGNINIGGLLDTRGSAVTFYDAERFTDAGEIRLESRSGDVNLLAGSELSVAADARVGNAGTVIVSAPTGQFTVLGGFDGHAGAGGTGGSFELDAGSIVSFSDLRDLLDAGGFDERRAFRLRTGSVAVEGLHKTRVFKLATDTGSISVAGTIDASGVTGGRIDLVAREDLEIQAGARLDASAREFSSAGKGGSIYLEAGASTGGTAGPGTLRILAGSTIDLSVDAYQQGASALPNGDYLDPTSSAFQGRFQGTLHLRAPQIAGNTDLAVNKIGGAIVGASSILVEGYRIYTPALGTMNIALRGTVNANAASFITANEAAMRTKLFGATPNAGLDNILVVAPGVEIVNPAGDLTLGLANLAGSTNPEALTTADWDLSGFRYGSREAPGVLTLRASGDLVFNNALSDGFSPVANNGTNGNSLLWLATPQEINALLPINTQSWTFRLTAGADLASASASGVLPIEALAPNKGSILVGEFHAAPPLDTAGTDATQGDPGRTMNHMRINRSSNLTSAANDRGTRFEVIRTGTGSIDLNAARDVQLRNTFSTIYTAGVAIPLSSRTRIFESNDFVVPILTRFQGGSPPIDPSGLGAVQQTYGVYYTMAGGDVRVQAGEDIGRFTQFGGQVIPDSTRQLPSNWLMRRGYVDTTGTFGEGGVIGSGSSGSVSDPSASTTWWIDFSNFFQGIGALGGGDISLTAGEDIINADAVIPTNARMKGRDPLLGVNVAPDAANLLEYGGGDLVVRAGDAISGGSFYAERGHGILAAGGDITTNSARSLSLGILSGSAVDPATSLSWLPTVLYVGKGRFDVTARGSALLGPTTNPFLLPQGMTNRFWYKTQFNTFSEDAGATVAAYGGDVTHRLVDRDGRPILFGWADIQNTLASNTAAYRQPWLRLAESTINQGAGSYRASLSLAAPNLLSTSFSGDVNIVGSLTLYPSPRGSLEIVAAGEVPGLQPVAFDTTSQTTLWTSARISVSDASPSNFPGVASPLAFQSIVSGSRAQADLTNTQRDPLGSVVLSIFETGAIEGAEASIVRQNALHSRDILHANNPEPVRIYALGGDISGLTLFSPKAARVIASRDITDIGFYLQNADEESISVVSAGRDLILFNENYARRTGASSEGNSIIDPLNQTTTTTTRALPGDIQIGGRGTLEVFAGRDIDLGTGANFSEGGLGKGITSIGRKRNPFLPIDGARLVVIAGINGRSGGPALSLTDSNLDFESFRDAYLNGGSFSAFAGLDAATRDLLAKYDSLSEEEKNLVALDVFFALLRQASEEFAETGSYATGLAATETLFGTTSGTRGNILTRARDIRTASGGGISLLTPGGGITMASDIFGNPLTPPGIVTALGGPISIFMEGSLDIGAARVFTLRGGDITIWSSSGDIAAGSSAKTVVSAPPTRVTIDATSGEVVTDLGGLATGGGIGVLASVEGVEPGGVYLIAPQGTVDAGDAGIRATGDINIAAAAVVNADNIAAGGTSSGVPAPAAPPAVNVGGLSSASSATGATTSAANQVANQARPTPTPEEEEPSQYDVEVLGYGGEE